MGAPTQVYVDPAIAADSGSGTIGDPYGDLQYALNTVTRDSTNGNQFNIKAGTDEILSAAISLATYGTPTFDAPLIFRGYTSAANDGGQGGISGAGAASIHAGATAVSWIDLHLHNVGTRDLLVLGQYALVANCEIDNWGGSTNAGVQCGAQCQVLNNYIHNGAGYGIDASVNDGVLIYGNYLANGASDFNAAIIMFRSQYATRNIISIDGASKGITIVNAFGSVISHNSILSGGGTGVGIELVADGGIQTSVFNNLVEGFSGVGGKGFSRATSSRNSGVVRNNALYNNATNYENLNSGEYIFADPSSGMDNETLSGTPFAKSGSDTFANRFTYFAPLDVGNVWGGGWPGGNLDKGAVQHADPAGGGGGVPANLLGGIFQ